MDSRTIKVDYLPRVEGEGAMKVVVRDGKIESAEFNIFEPPRFFEAFLRGRAFSEAPDMTARICGICPVAYQMSTVHAMENALGVSISPQIRALRRLLYCGEWIESHVLHITMLHAPDFLGYDGVAAMAQDYGDMVRSALALKKTGNELLTFLGGREIHPINVRVGGFYRAPRKAEFAPITEKLKTARDLSLGLLRWVSTFDFPDRQRDYTFVALRHPNEYPFNEGRIVSSKGLDIAVSDYDAHFEELHVPRTTALHSLFRNGGGAYLVGPLARYSLNFDRLSPLVQEAAHEAGLGETCANPYQSIMVRAVETLHACDEALRLIEAYEEPVAPAAIIVPRAGTGYAATEAPRGLLYHRYGLEEDGTIAEAQIVPPTSQNQASMEEDLTQFIETFLDLPDEALRVRCEQTIRNYDPCISCATHFLRLDMDRG